MLGIVSPSFSTTKIAHKQCILEVAKPFLSNLFAGLFQQSRKPPTIRSLFRPHPEPIWNGICGYLSFFKIMFCFVFVMVRIQMID